MKSSKKQLRRDSRLFGELAQDFLQAGTPVRFRAEGASMQPNLTSGELLTVTPVDPADVRRGNIVLTREGEGFKAHRVVSQDQNHSSVATRGDAGWANDSIRNSDILGRVSLSEHDSTGNQVAHDSRFSFWKASTRRIIHKIRAAVSLRMQNSVSLTFFALAATSGLLLLPATASAQADLSLTQTASTTVVSPGGTITYTEAITNNGPNAVNDAVLYQQTPPNTTFNSLTCPAGWTLATPAAGATGSVTCTDGASFASGAVANFTYVVNVAAGVASGTTILNTADATSSSTDPTPSNNANTTSVLVEAAGGADLAVSMTAAPTPVFISGLLTYTVQVQNLGPVATTSAVLTDTLPAAATFVSSTAVPAGVTCTGAGPVVCTLGVLAVGAVDTITITVKAPATAQNLSNTAAITASAPADPVGSNNTVTAITVVQPLICALPGNDGAGGSLTGIVNAYYPPGAGVTGAAAGATSIKIGAASAAGAQKAIAVNDLILIIQMQNATINSTNTSSYGDGIAGDPATGSTNINNTGQFEFVVAISAVPVGGGTLNFLGAGASNGLLNSYNNVVASSSQGQSTFQVIRVPQYGSATLTSTLTAQPWNGSTGGVLAIDVSGQLTLGGTVAVDGEGFRGGGGRILGGGTGASTDYVTLSTNNANGSKGEGIAGTPAFVAPVAGFNTTATATATGQTFVEGLPSGSYARGAPGNAGGGATDANPAANDQNSGGGAGANGGTGGNGGFGWNSAGIVGGFGGTPFIPSTGTLILGGGGGAGTTNNGTFYIPSTGTGGGGTGLFSSGAQGGGIAILHAGSIIGTGSVTANGGAVTNVENDGGGGGAAGGSIRIFANSGNFAGLTVEANGGIGGTTWQTQAPGTPFPGNRHGPGGGGGGGVIFLSATPAAASVSGGSNGFTTTANDAYGATVGLSGLVGSNFTINETPGAQPGAECASADLAVTNSGTPNVVVPGNAITYTQTVTNNGPLAAVNAVFSEAVPANTTFTSLTIPTGWACTTPAVGAAGNITCTDPNIANAGTGTFTLKVTVNGATVSGTQIVDTANITSGIADPDLTNNTATVLTVVGLATTANIAVTKTASPNPVLAGNKITYTIVVTNNGPAAAANVQFNDPIPTGTTFSSLTQTGNAWTCPAPTTAVQCTLNPFPSGGTTTFKLIVTVPAGTASGTVIKNTASTSSTTTDSNPGSNSSTATVTVASTGQFDLIDSSSASPNPVTAGNQITFTQTVTNAGPSASTAGAAVFTGSVPAGTTFDSLVIPARWICNTLPAVGSTGAISCCLGTGTTCSATRTIASGSVLQFPLVVTVNPGTASGTKITDTSSIAPTVNDVNPANNTSSASTVVGAPTDSDVAIVKTGAPQPVDQGTNLTYTLQVTNNGPGVARGVSVLDPLPVQVSFVSVSTTQGTCAQAAGTVTCNIGTMSVGGLAIITINTTATTFSSSTTATNTASVTSTTNDPNLLNNLSSVITTIQAPTAVQVSSFRAQNIPGGGVVLEWSTREEIRNLGFHVYREDAQGRHQINPSIIAGGALFMRGGQPQHAARTYRWIDPQGTAQSSYILEDVDLNGTRMSHGPVSPDSTVQESAPIVPALLLSQLNRSASPTAHVPFHPVGPIAAPNPVTTPEVSGSFLDERPAAKISVRAEGWYSVSGAQLAAAGFEAGESRNLQLYAEGVEQPIRIISKQNGRLGPNDSVAFYGTGIDTPFSDTRVYWLINGSQTGKRIYTSATGSGTANVSSFSDAVTLQQRTTYFAALLNGINNDNFFGAAVNSEPVDQLLAVSHLDTNSSIPMELDVTLQGVTDGQPHSVSVVLNGESLGTMNFSNQSNTTNTFSVSPGLVQNGTNTVTLAALDGDNDISLVQSITLHYPHTYAADSNWLRASAPAGSRVQFTGFSNSQIQVFDITNPLAVEQLSGPIAFENSGSAITVSVPGAASAAPRTLLAFSADQIAAPSGISFHAGSSLLQQRQGAAIVMITDPAFESTLAPLVALRKSQNNAVAVVTTDDLYDAYNYGERSPFAVRSYLQAASTEWREKPQSVLLVGDASFDPRNYLGFGDFDFVPTRLIETAAFKTASDDWLSDFAETGFATIPTGRIPARIAADASLVVSKIVNYENGNSAGPWTHQALVIADQNVGVDFTSEANSAGLILPASLMQTKILADGLDPATASQEIIAAINSGALLVNYTGHGAEQQWSFSDLLDNTSAAALTNGNRLPVFLIMDCLNGFFHDVFAESLSSALLFAPNGGAVGVWASSGFTTAPPQATMDQALLSTLSANPSQSIGRAIITAKSGILDPDVRRTWNFFGDPAMQVAFPASTVTPSRPRRVSVPDPVVR